MSSVATKKFSEEIAFFLNMCEATKSNLEYYRGEVNRMDELTQDYLHKLELGELDYRGRAKIATAIAKCRKDRRTYKDCAAILEPMVEFLDNNTAAINRMKEALGKTRKAEKNIENRKYYPRVLTEKEMFDR